MKRVNGQHQYPRRYHGESTESWLDRVYPREKGDEFHGEMHLIVVNNSDGHLIIRKGGEVVATSLVGGSYHQDWSRRYCSLRTGLALLLAWQY